MIKWSSFEEFEDLEVRSPVEKEVAAVEVSEIDHTGPAQIGVVIRVVSNIINQLLVADAVFKVHLSYYLV